MKIKAVMLGLAVSAVLCYANLDEVRQKEHQVDNLVIDTTNPQYLKELTKSMIRIDFISQQNMKAIVELSGFLKEISQEVDKLKKEVSKLKQQLNRAEISQAIGCEVHRVSNIVNSLNDKGLIEIDRLKKRSVDIYNVFKIRTAPNHDLTQEQQDLLIYLKNRKGAYDCNELAYKVAIEYFPMIKELKDLKEKGLIDMWHSKNSDGYAYNVKNNSKGEYETSLIEFFYSQQDRIKIRREKAKRFSETTPC